MYRFLILIMLAFTLTACSEYQKVMKSTDFEKKFELAQKYYNEENYGKAIDLIEPTLTFSTGTEKGEQILFIYANSLYKTESYVMAGYYFKKFTNTYPNSTLTEEASYMSAYCSYLDSPKPNLDQANTLRAIKEFELFISRYPQSNYITDCNQYMDNLRAKLEEKSFINARLYYDMEMYKSAVIALKNSLIEFPDSEYREQMMYLIVKANFLYAQGSITARQQERYNNTLKAVGQFKSAFSESKYLKEIERMKKKSETALTELTAAN